VNCFWRLLDAINSGQPLPPVWLTGVKRENCVFPLLNAAEWGSLPGHS
jgi:1,4-alpha-glucan branching enzyme